MNGQWSAGGWSSDWLTIVKLPPYAPDLTPVEGVWAHVNKSLANLAPRAIEDHLTPPLWGFQCHFGAGDEAVEYFGAVLDAA